jgi:hypothetical protein
MVFQYPDPANNVLVASLIVVHENMRRDDMKQQRHSIVIAGLF